MNVFNELRTNDSRFKARWWSAVALRADGIESARGLAEVLDPDGRVWEDEFFDTPEEAQRWLDGLTLEITDPYDPREGLFD